MIAQSLAVGDFAQVAKTLTETELSLLTGISGDFNPFHVDEVASAAGRFGGRVVHGMLTSLLICTVLGLRLPGPKTIDLEQTLRFLGPVRPGDTVTARVEVIELLPKGRIRLATDAAGRTASSRLREKRWSSVRLRMAIASRHNQPG